MKSGMDNTHTAQPGSVAHTVLLRWAAHAPADQGKRVAAALNSMARNMQGTLFYRAGQDLGIKSGNADFAVFAVFATPEDYLRYARDSKAPGHHRRAHITLPSRTDDGSNRNTGRNKASRPRLGQQPGTLISASRNLTNVSEGKMERAASNCFSQASSSYRRCSCAWRDPEGPPARIGACTAPRRPLQAITYLQGKRGS